MLSVLIADNSQAAEQQYQSLRLKLVWYFKRHRCRCCEEMADETLYRVFKSMNNGNQVHRQYTVAFVWALAKNIRREECKERRHEPLDVCSCVSHDSCSEMDRHIYVGECIDSALSPEEAVLFRSCCCDGYESTASRLGVAPRFLRVKVHRSKQKIRRFVEHL